MHPRSELHPHPAELLRLALLNLLWRRAALSPWSPEQLRQRGQQLSLKLK